MKHNYQKPTVDAVQLTTKHASFQITSENYSRKYSGSIVDDEQPEEEQ